MTEITETIAGITPSKSNCYRIVTIHNHGSLAKTETLKRYENSFYLQCKNRGAMVTGFFDFAVDVYYPNNRADLDNSLKVILDCLQTAKVIKNDNQCVSIIARKFVDKANPRIQLIIKPVNG